ncbi:uncharacterized protein DS421_6g189780 [Arachis hypogaea]|nr:uncharacterized protein DS421_6g189780 [Arachis hypogaea]
MPTNLNLRNEIPPKFRNPIPPKFNPHPPSSTPPLLSPSAETSTAGCALAGAAAGSGPTGHETVHHSTRHCRIPHLIHVQLSPWEKKDMVGRDRGRGRGRGHGRGRGRRRKGRPRLSTGHPLDLHANPYSLIRLRTSRGRVIHADASFAFFPATRSRRPRFCVTCAFQSVRSCEPCGRVTTNSFLPRGRIADAYASLLAGHLINFLCSFHFCKLPSQSLTHSCPIKPETLNTQIKASNDNKRGLRLAKLRPKKHVFNHVGGCCGSSSVARCRSFLFTRSGGQPEKGRRERDMKSKGWSKEEDGTSDNYAKARGRVGHAIAWEAIIPMRRGRVSDAVAWDDLGHWHASSHALA